MSTEKRRVRSFVFDGEFHEHEWLEDALEHMGLEISDDLLSIIDDNCTVLLVESAGELPPEMMQMAARTPEGHKEAFAASSMAIFQTISSRDPVLVIDAGPLFIMVVTQGDKIEGFIAGRYGKELPLKDPPADPAQRWIVTIAQNETIARQALGIGPKPGIGRA